MGTMLLIVGWSAVVVWLNVRPHKNCIEVPGRFRDVGTGPHACDQVYGCPWFYGRILYYHERPDPCPPLRFDIEKVVICDFPALAANAAIGLLAVAVLAFAPKHLLRRIVSVLRTALPPNEAFTLLKDDCSGSTE
jgi:hypothetical protein